MDDRNSPMTRACPHCKNANAKLMPPAGDYSEYSCPNCGEYRVSGTMERLIKLGTVDPKSAHIEQRNGYRCLVQ